MIQEFKSEFNRVASLFDATFTTKNVSEYEDYVQNFSFQNASINLVPIKRYRSEIDLGGVVRYIGTTDIYFLTKFVKSDNYENDKDELIDEMVLLSEAFYRELHRNENLLFISPQWKWVAEIIRQYTSNVLCGVKVTLDFDTACNRTGLVSV